MGDLQRLVEAVERGVDTAHHHAAAFPSESAYGHCTWHDSHKASGGDLNAAKSLHEALLPGWIYDLTNGSCFVMRTIDPDDDDANPQYLGESDVDARAWLLSILRAVEAKGGVA